MRHRHFPLLIAAVAILLVLGSLRAGLRLDDFYERWVIVGSPVYSDVGLRPIDAFRFVDGNPQRTRRMIDTGLVPWWINPHIKGAFWKPLTVFTHMIDYRLWPGWPSLMHAQSIFWFGFWIFGACLLYRRVMRATTAAALAGLLYAVDYARATPAGWLANRNAVLAGLFGILAIYAHYNARRARSRTWGIASPVLLAMSLLSAEVGIGAVAYLVAFACTLDRDGWRRGLVRLWPHALVVIAWRLAWNAQGYGVYAADVIYTDPLQQPARFALDVLQRSPLYMLGQWTAIPAELHLALSSLGVALMRGAGVAVAVIVLLLALPLLRRSRVARFWGLGMILSIIPMCSAAPMNRYLVFIGLGAMGLLGQLLTTTTLRPRFWRSRPLPSRAAWGALLGLLVAIHLVISPIALVVVARFPVGPDDLLDSFCAIPFEPDPSRDVILVNHPLPMGILHWFTGRAVDRQPLPRRARVLAPATTELSVRRVDANTLLVRPDGGFLTAPASRLGYSTGEPFSVGQTIDLPLMRVTIAEMTADARPAAVLFRFNVPLEDDSLQWVAWESGGFKQFRPPSIGEVVRLPASGLPL
jgi:hypothetical protein